MKFTAQRTTLLEALKVTGTVIGTSYLSILSSYLFIVNDDEIEVTGGSTDIFVRNVIKIEPSGIKISIAIPKDKLFDLVKDSSSQVISFEIIKNDELIKSAGDTNSTSAKITTIEGEYILPIENGEDFPTMVVENEVEFSLSSENLLQGMEKTIFAVGEDMLRPELTGILMKVENSKIEYVATNTHILSTFSIPLEKPIEIRKTFILPGKTAKLLQGLPFDGDCKIMASDKNLQIFIKPDLCVQALLVSGKFPDYECVIPNKQHLHLNVDRQQFIGSVKRVSKFANVITTQIVLTLTTNRCKIDSYDVDFGQRGEETLVVDYDGEVLEIGCNGKILLSILNKLKTENVSISFSQPNRAIVIREFNDEMVLNSKEDLMLLMPLFLKDR